MSAIFYCMVVCNKPVLLNKSFFSGQNSEAAVSRHFLMNSLLVNGRADTAISLKIFGLTFVTDSDSFTVLLNMFCWSEGALLN
jgi:hypothetical protein